MVLFTLTDYASLYQTLYWNNKSYKAQQVSRRETINFADHGLFQEPDETLID